MGGIIVERKFVRVLYVWNVGVLILRIFTVMILNCSKFGIFGSVPQSFYLSIASLLLNFFYEIYFFEYFCKLLLSSNTLTAILLFYKFEHVPDC